ncbi:26.5 kDa heat shock protein, mitochondrial isoform X2 [Euphorbia lathyris]|uniref:26.5 kDa heat shock protein, mitochondrial isoform X2 n=1 Tax=Euphorbia lathyris TaxID=212925 RepID=UPI0033131439
MALALRNLSKRVTSSSSETSIIGIGGARRQRWNDELFKRFMATNGQTSNGKQVAVSEADSNKSKLKKAKRDPWRNNSQQFVPQLYGSGLGNALLQATENINRLFEKLKLSSTNLMGDYKEKDECYKLRYEVPGLSKEELKITIDDGVMIIKGESKEEEEDDEHWSMRRYGYYNTSVVLPDDVKTDEIKAELRNGVLHITIPRTHQPKKDPKEVPIH